MKLTFTALTHSESTYSFIFSELILNGEYKVYFKSSNFKEESYIIDTLFKTFNEIDEIFVHSNMITVSINNNFEFTGSLIKSISNVINKFIDLGFYNNEFTTQLVKINDVITNYVNPALDMDGGAYILADYSMTNRSLTLIGVGFCGSQKSQFDTNIDFDQIKNITMRVHKIEIDYVVLRKDETRTIYQKHNNHIDY